MRPSYQRRAGGGGGPGGWWIVTEVEVQLPSDEVVRPDVVGWRRDRVPARPTGSPVPHLPDWICEVVSPTNANNDTVKKLRTYHVAGVPHYWIVDPRDATLTGMRCRREETSRLSHSIGRGTSVAVGPACLHVYGPNSPFGPNVQ